MKYLASLVPIATTLFIYSMCLAQSPSTYRAMVYGGYADDIDSLVISTPDKHITVFPNGATEGKIDGRDVEFIIPVAEDTFMASLYMTVTDSTLIFLYEESIATHSSTHFAIFDRSDISLIVQEDIYAFNLRKPVFKDYYMYLMTLDFAGKYDLRNKTYVWSHSGLYNRERHTFNLIDPPVFENGSVMFTSTNRELTDTLVVDDISGEILLKTN